MCDTELRTFVTYLRHRGSVHLGSWVTCIHGYGTRPFDTPRTWRDRCQLRALYRKDYTNAKSSLICKWKAFVRSFLDLAEIATSARFMCLLEKAHIFWEDQHESFTRMMGLKYPLGKATSVLFVRQCHLNTLQEDISGAQHL